MISFPVLIFLPDKASGQGNKYLPSQLKIGTDLSYIGASLLSEDKTQYEFNVDIDFNRFLVTGDYGSGSWLINEPDYDYENSGSYFRAGIDFNFLNPSPANNALYIGARYASATFTENFTFRVDDPVFGSYTKDFNDIDRSGSWFEFVTGMKVRVWKGLFLGWTGRLKFASSVSSEPSSFSTFWMPNFGKTEKDSHWGLNYQIFYQIPLFKKRYAPLKKPVEIENGQEEMPESGNE